MLSFLSLGRRLCKITFVDTVSVLKARRCGAAGASNAILSHPYKRCLYEAVKAKGVRVTVISTVKSQPQVISDDLRREADVFIDLADMADLIARPRRDTDDRANPVTEDDYED